MLGWGERAQARCEFGCYLRRFSLVFLGVGGGQGLGPGGREGRARGPRLFLNVVSVGSLGGGAGSEGGGVRGWGEREARCEFGCYLRCF